MKTLKYIFPLALLMVVASCQKDEFEDVIQEASDPAKVASQKVVLPLPDGDSVEGNDYFESKEQVNQVQESKVGTPDVYIGEGTGTIKEVSDGDDEADDGDDSQITD